MASQQNYFSRQLHTLFTGFDKVSSTVHPLFRRSYIVWTHMFISRAHSDAVLVMPLYVINRLLRVLLCWVVAVAQRQFSGEYGPLTSILSIDVPGGLSPMSFKNWAKSFFHASHMAILRPPYKGYNFELEL